MEQEKSRAVKGNQHQKPAGIPQAAEQAGAAAKLPERGIHGCDGRVQARSFLRHHQESCAILKEKSVAAATGHQGKKQEKSGKGLATNHHLNPHHHQTSSPSGSPPNGSSSQA